MMYIKAQYPLFPNAGTVTLFIPVYVEGGDQWWFEAVRQDGIIGNMKVHQRPLPDDAVQLCDSDPFIAELPKIARNIVLGTLARRNFTEIFQSLTIGAYDPDADHGQHASQN